MSKKTSIFSNKKLIMFFLFMIIILPLFEPYLKIHEGFLDDNPVLKALLFGIIGFIVVGFIVNGIINMLMNNGNSTTA